MSTEPIVNRCPKCQAPLPANAPQGLCPKCLLAAVSTPTEAGQPADKNPPPSIPAVAAAFPQLEILELIGRGGMGAVYKARQPRLDRLVALKLLPQSLAADATFAERFNREARVLARLNHPSIVTVHDFGQSDGFFYLLMEFVDGVSLRQAMQAGRFTPQQAMMIVPKICEALQFAHDEGVLHRDIKPENILLDTRGRVKIADFGIAKLVGEAREKLTLTASGAAVGTPHYMAPEQLEHPQDVDQRADIYSLGVVFYEMLTGELPIGRFAPPSEKSEVDARVDEVVLRALEKEREKRFRSVTEVKTSVEAITSNPAAGPAPPAPGGAPAQPSAGPAASAGPVPCYFNTPARMRDCFPSAAARVFTCKGELQLDDQHLTFTSSWRNSITIPFKDIEDLSVGQFQMWATAWVMKYARLNFLSVTYRQQGQSRTVLLTPVEPQAANASQINEGVGRWHERLRQGVKRATGALPHRTDPASLAISAEPAWNWKGLPLLFGLMLISVPIWLNSGHLSAPSWAVIGGLGAIFFMALTWLSVGFLQANSALWRGDLDAVTSDDPLDTELADASREGVNVGGRRWRRRLTPLLYNILVGLLLLPPIVYILQRATGTSQHEAEEAYPPPPAAAVRLAPESDAQFVLYTVPAPGAYPSGVLHWTFKCLVPANHLARVLFVRWTNGMPKIEPGGSAYFKVGKASIDEDFYLSCERLAQAPATGVTNKIQWAVSLVGHVTTSLIFQREPAYQPLETSSRLTVRSGHQGILRLVEYVTSEHQSSPGRSGIELRIFLEPLKSPPIRTDPFEVEGTNYVAGHALNWTMDEALKAIKEWPEDQ
jgi:serine/threonine protein kinase